ncbi:MAG: bifunctional glutamate N-acetyltransferase/amino-acid acetyltransferase ArgJ [Verrucomicrobiae bacterium]|nr:bifunctional glutamate N-acetyltransferase/amino-acid acetyltransferase ArgJ [Verrucomicrobiae bacterium]
MKPPFKSVPSSINAPTGFRSAGVFCNVKKLGTGKGSDKGEKRDLALIVSDSPAIAAGMFTTNQICAAPVKLCVANIANARAQAIVVNSGNANACTGEQGMLDAWEMAAATARALSLPADDILVASTGRIGLTLPMPNIHTGIAAASVILDNTATAAGHVAEAIMTSDSRPKEIAVEIKLGGKTVRIGGICKGAGMIQPGMSPTGARPASLPLHATMLGFVTTDAAIAPKALQAALRQAVANSFNRITVDGDMSTNDTVIVLANGLAGNPKIPANGFKNNADFQKFEAALCHVCLELAKMIVRDGEGVHRVVKVMVSGAKSVKEADQAARAVANSALVKTSWHGGDPNWGRIIDALGYSDAKVVENKVDIGYSASGKSKITWSLKQGQPTKTTFERLCQAVAPKEFDLHIHLNLGTGSTFIYAADLTEEYVEFNKGDIADPASLGG